MKKPAPHDVPLFVRLTKEEHKRLAQLAEADGVSLSARIRRMIREAVIPQPVVR
jgi:predicted HicB family RNase H-like nuclease